MKNKIWLLSILPLSALATIVAVIDPSNYYFIRLGTGFHFLISLIGIILLLAKAVRKRAQPITIQFKIADLAIVVLLGYLGLRFFLSSDYRVFPDKIITFYTCFIFYGIYRILAYNKHVKTAYVALYVILGFGIIQSVYALLQWFHLLPNLFNYRMGGTYGNPGDLANTLVIPYAISLGLLLRSTSRRAYILLLGSTVLILAVIGLSMARTSWIAVSIISIIQIWSRYSHEIRNLIRKISIPIRLITILFVILMGVLISIKLFQIKQDSAYGRIFIWERCLERIAEKPVFGHGYESFITLYNKTQSAYFQKHPNDVANGLIADDNFFAFNDYLQYTVEYGVVGLSLLLWLILIPLSQKKFYRRKNPISNLINAGLIGLLISMCFSYPLQNLSIQWMFFLLIAINASLQPQYIFRLPLSGIKQRILALPLLLALLVSFSISVIFIHYGLKWKKAFTYYEQQQPIAIDQYQALLPILKYERSFLYNYGTMLHTMGKYNQCLKHFESYPNILWTTDLLLVVADCYDKTRNHVKAEEYYWEASYIKPHLYAPKYKLFKLYRRIDNHEKAIEIAHEIQSMPIKVNSSVVMTIKNEINRYLLSTDYK